MTWQVAIYNEFRDTWLRWYDYCAIIICGFPVVLVRRYDWMEKQSSSLTVFVLGFKLRTRIWRWKKPDGTSSD